MDPRIQKQKMAKSIKNKNKIKYKIKELEIHLEKRGWFIEMLRRNGLKDEIKQISVASIKPGRIRGNHYHLNKTEWFFIINGKANFYLENPRTRARICLRISSKKPKVITVFPRIAHAVENIDKKTIYFIEADSVVYNHKKPDSIPYPIC